MKCLIYVFFMHNDLNLCFMADSVTLNMKGQSYNVFDYHTFNYQGPVLFYLCFQSTEDSHKDKVEILNGINAMTDVAKAINEYKRRKDLGNFHIWQPAILDNSLNHVSSDDCVALIKL